MPRGQPKRTRAPESSDMGDDEIEDELSEFGDDIDNVEDAQIFPVSSPKMGTGRTGANKKTRAPGESKPGSSETGAEPKEDADEDADEDDAHESADEDDARESANESADEAAESIDGTVSEIVRDEEEPQQDQEPLQTSVEERLPFMETDVVRNATENMIVIDDDDRRTSQIMSIPEYTEAISIRTEQISADGSQGAMIDVQSIPILATSARDIAIAEMKARRCPLKIVRHVGCVAEGVGGRVKNYVEIWSPNSMTHPPFL